VVKFLHCLKYRCGSSETANKGRAAIIGQQVGQRCSQDTWTLDPTVALAFRDAQVHADADETATGIGCRKMLVMKGTGIVVGGNVDVTARIS
jgi:hypothetical protein